MPIRPSLAALCAGLFLCLATAGADIVRLKDGRELKCDEVIDKGDFIEIRHKLGSMTIEKSKVKEIIKEDVVSQDEGDEKTTGTQKQPVIYKSLILGFTIEVPSPGWFVKRFPPEPLCDVAMCNTRWNGKVLIKVKPADQSKLDFTEAGAKAFADAVRSSASIYFDTLQVDSAALGKFKDGPAIRATLKGIRKGFSYEEVIVLFTFPTQQLLYTLEASGVKKRAADLEAALNSIIESWNFFEPKEIDGDVFTSFEYFFSVAKPPDWKFQTETDAACAMASGDGKTSFKIHCYPDKYKGMQLDRVGRSVEAEFKNSSPEAKLETSRMANLKGTFCWELVYKLGADMRKEHFFFAGEALLHSVFSAPADAKETQAVFDTVFGSFQIFRDTISKGSVEKSLKALDLAYDGDKLSFSGKEEAALTYYDDAIREFPHYSTAYNNKGVALLRSGKLDEALKALERARELWAEDPLVCLNLAIVRINRSIAALNQGKPATAAHEFEAAIKVAERFEELAKEFKRAYVIFGNYYLAKNEPDKAATWYKKALRNDPGNVEIKEAIATCYYNEAVGYFNKRDFGRASSKAKECFRLVPDFGPAKELLALIEQARKGK